MNIKSFVLSLVLIMAVTPVAFGYNLTSKLTGQTFTSIDGDDYAFDSIFSEGIRLNKSHLLGSGSPKVDYVFIVPPSSVGTYDSLTISIYGDGVANFWVDGVQQSDIGDGLQSRTISSSYIDQESGYATLTVSLQANGTTTYDLSYVQVDLGISTANQWLDYYMRDILAYKVISESAGLMREWEGGGVASDLVMEGMIKATSFAKGLMDVGSGSLSDAVQATIDSINDFSSLVDTMTASFEWSIVQVSYTMAAQYLPGAIADALEDTYASDVKRLAAKWLTYGADGNLSTSEKQSLQTTMNQRAASLWGGDYSADNRIKDFIGGWAWVNGVQAGDSDNIWNWVQGAYYSVRPLMYYNLPTRGSASTGSSIETKSFLKQYADDLLDHAAVIVPDSPKLSGNVSTSSGSSISGVTVSADNGGGSNTTDINGNYELTVPYDWSGNVTANKAEYFFGNYWECEYITSDTSGLDFTGTYIIPDYTISVNSSGASGVSISSSTVHSGTTPYAKTVSSGTSVSLTAPSTASGKTFSGWTGSETSSSQTISFSMTANKAVTATYIVTLSSITISGASTIDENSFSTYGCTATYSDGSTSDVSPLTSWAKDGVYASINSSGVLTTTEVTYDQRVTITASYTESGITKENTCFVTILNMSSGYSGGSGTELDPYLIGTKEDLLTLGGSSRDYDKHFKMTSNIDLSGTNFTKAIIAPNIDYSMYWRYQGTKFTGTFDGNSNTIINLSIDGGSTNSYIGLFGFIGTGSEIKNLGIVDCNVSGSGYVGGLCGNNAGMIFTCYSTGSVSGHYNRVGGLCGGNYGGTISSCYSTGAVSGDRDVGGLCGGNYGGTILSCYSTGAVSGDRDVGGLCGYNVSGSISSCFWDTETSGFSSSAGGIGKTTAEMQTKSTFTDAGWNFVDTWQMYGYPVLRWQGHILEVHNGIGSGLYSLGEDITIESLRPDLFVFTGWTVEPTEYTNNFEDISSSTTTFTMPDTNVFITAFLDCYSGGTGIESDPYLIATKEDLLTLGDCPQHYNKHFKMISDIDLSGTNFTKAIIAPNIDYSMYWRSQGTKFTGTFDGNSNTIINLSIDGGSTNSYIGLFGFIGTGSEIKNLGIVDCNVSGRGYVGGLCGNNAGTIFTCYSTGSVNGGVSGSYVGGLCGGNSGGTILSCYSTGAVTGRSRVGGFCGYNVSGSISSCYSSGVVSADYGAGGLCGVNSGTINSGFWDTETSGQPESAGGISKTTAEMQTKSTFTDDGWDFVDTWQMYGYPVLQAFYTNSNTYQDWFSDSSIPVNEQAYTNMPSGDGIQNLLKYAIGLNPMEVCSAKDIMEPVVDETNGVSIIYKKAKGIEGVELFPLWTDYLLPANWNSNGFEFSIISQTDSNATWKATHSVTGESVYIRLKATIDD